MLRVEGYFYPGSDIWVHALPCRIRGSEPQGWSRWRVLAFLKAWWNAGILVLGPRARALWWD